MKTETHNAPPTSPHMGLAERGLVRIALQFYAEHSHKIARGATNELHADLYTQTACEAEDLFRRFVAFDIP